MGIDVKDKSPSPAPLRGMEADRKAQEQRHQAAVRKLEETVEGQLAQLAALRQGQAPPRIPPQCPNAGPYPTHLILTQVQGNVQFVRVFFAVFPMFFEGKRMSNSSQLSIFYWEISLSQQNLVLSKVCSFCKVLFVQRFHCVRSCFFLQYHHRRRALLPPQVGAMGRWVGGGTFQPRGGDKLWDGLFGASAQLGERGQNERKCPFQPGPKTAGVSIHRSSRALGTPPPRSQNRSLL